MPLSRAASLKKILRSYLYHADHYHTRLDLENFAFVPLTRAPVPREPLPRAAGLRIFCVRTTTTRGMTRKFFVCTTTTRTTNTRGWTSKVLRSYHYQARLDLENSPFVPLTSAPLTRVPLPRAGGFRKFCVRANSMRGWTYKLLRTNALPIQRAPLTREPLPRAVGLKKILRSYHYHTDHYHAQLD